MSVPLVGNVGSMGASNLRVNFSERKRSAVGIVRSLLLISAVLFGLFSMHVLQHSGSTPPSVPSIQQIQHPASAEMVVDHSSVSHTGHNTDLGCADCPMGHDMAAAGCVLALLAIMLCFWPPRTLKIAKPGDSYFLPALKLALNILPSKPDLTALGISRT